MRILLPIRRIEDHMLIHHPNFKIWTGIAMPVLIGVTDRLFPIWTARLADIFLK